MLDSFYEIQIPNELREVAGRHQQHIVALISQLQSAGLDDGLIERSVDQLIASYRSELMKAVKALKGHSNG
jgi:hypothetical protein